MAQAFSDLLTQVFANDFDAGTYTPQAKQAINDALDLIARSGGLPLLQATYAPTMTAGVGSVAAPADIVRLTSVSYTDGAFDIVGVNIGEFDDQSVAVGRPYLFSLYDQVIYLYPTPDQAYPLQFRYLRDPAALSADADLASAIIPDNYANMLVAFARHRLFRLEDDVQMSQFWRAEFDRDLRLLKVDLQRESVGQPKQIQGMFRRHRRPMFNRP